MVCSCVILQDLSDVVVFCAVGRSMGVLWMYYFCGNVRLGWMYCAGSHRVFEVARSVWLPAGWRGFGFARACLIASMASGIYFELFLWWAILGMDNLWIGFGFARRLHRHQKTRLCFARRSHRHQKLD